MNMRFSSASALFARGAPASVMGQRGLTVVELLISLVIGLVVLAAGGAVYVYSGRSSRVSNVGTQLNEDGVLAMNFLQSESRQAGYSQKAIKNSQGALFRGAAIRGCSGGFKKNKLTAGYREAYADTICEVTDAAASGNSASDALLVRYEADTSNTFPNTSGNPTNCNGEGITSTVASPVGMQPATYRLADNRFLLLNGSLQCAGSTGASINTSQPLFANVEQMVLRYGVAEQSSLEQANTFDTNHHQIVAYLTAAEVDQLPTAKAGVDAMDDRWGHVLSVRICLLVRSPDSVKDASNANNYTDCNNAAKVATDSRLRRTFVSTVMLRNRMVLPVCPNDAATC